MHPIAFEWDHGKSEANKRKHGVSFEEAATVFYDRNARVIADPDHSQSEDRFVIVGVSERLRVLVVCHCYRKSASVIRIITARRASGRERNIYKEHLS